MTIDTLLAFGMGLEIILVGLYVLGAQLYDIRTATDERVKKLHPYASQQRRRPVVTIIVLADAKDNAAALGRCVQSLSASSYRKLNIILACRRSPVGVKKGLSTILPRAVSHRLQYFDARRYRTAIAAGMAAYKSKGSGELLMLISESSTLDRQAISTVVAQFNQHPAVTAIGFNERPIFNNTVAGLLDCYLSLLRAWIGKLADICGGEYASGIQHIVYRVEAFHLMAVQGNWSGDWQTSYRYATGAVLYRDAVATMRGLLRKQVRLQTARLKAIKLQCLQCFSIDYRYRWHYTWLRLPLAILSGFCAAIFPLLLGYALYLSFGHSQPGLFSMTVLASLFLILVAVWDATKLSTLSKFRYGIGAPMFVVSAFVGCLIWPVVLLAEVLLTLFKWLKPNNLTMSRLAKSGSQ